MLKGIQSKSTQRFKLKSYMSFLLFLLLKLREKLEQDLLTAFCKIHGHGLPASLLKEQSFKVTS